MIKCINKQGIFSLLCIAMLITTPARAERIVVFGASGDVGSVIVKEALSRGHTVVGVSRSPDKFNYSESNFIGLEGNPTEPESVRAVIANADAIINSVGGRVETDINKTPMVLTAKALTSVISELEGEKPHLVIIAGASLMGPLGKEDFISNLPGEPQPGSAEYATFLGHWDAYEIYKNSEINWTLLSPAWGLLGYRRGENIRTGNYRSSTKAHVKDAEGNNSISMDDFAIAALDFAEKGLFNKQKVTVGY